MTDQAAILLAGATATQIHGRYRRARIKLIRAREARGLTRPELGRLIGITRFTVWRVEMGETTPQIEMMAKWIKQLGPNASLDLFLRPKKGG